MEEKGVLSQPDRKLMKILAFGSEKHGQHKTDQLGVRGVFSGFIAHADGSTGFIIKHNQKITTRSGFLLSACHHANGPACSYVIFPVVHMTEIAVNKVLVNFLKLPLHRVGHSMAGKIDTCMCPGFYPLLELLFYEDMALFPTFYLPHMDAV